MTGADTLDLFDAPPESGPSRSRRRLVLAAAGGLALSSAMVHAARRSERGPSWWRLVPVPLTRVAVSARCWSVLWDLVRGAAHVRQPDSPELARRYAELLAENVGQPGFREHARLSPQWRTHRPPPACGR